ncbi:cell wall-binding repeat-containing protein [Sutcliffiella rhizosphaerae]|uniref:Transglycosylase SLT domain-containing protein n=1 Tax=Sutcliffiella rhizosphaerae TaxID=2880967 RepID=A0ABM8YN63_9BACI|nr:cell wall-binding repeat-containing protein [Sutcliffiella rhizosphaerae]CAG9621402.1 hypothetical protein BACCIP111883_02175 [Sutcliffiella rhizosphaerae]
MQKCIIAVKLCLIFMLALSMEKVFAEQQVQKYSLGPVETSKILLGDFEVSIMNGETSNAVISFNGNILEKLDIDLAIFSSVFTWSFNDKDYILFEFKKQGTGGYMQFTVLQLEDGESSQVYTSEDYLMGFISEESGEFSVSYAEENASLIDSVTYKKDKFSQEKNGSFHISLSGEKLKVIPEKAGEEDSFQLQSTSIRGENPSVAQINVMLTQEALLAGVPPEIIKAIAWQESTWRQFRTNDEPSGLWKKGDPIVSFDGGIGIMQITEPNMASERERRLKEDIRYNIQEGIRILKEKWSYNNWGRIPKINGNDMNVLEDWYFAVMAYNGISRRNDPKYYPNNTYQDVIYRHVERYAQMSVSKFPVTHLHNDIYYNTAGSLHFRRDQYHINGQFTKSKHVFSENELVKATESGVRLRRSPEGAEVRFTTAGEVLQVVGPFQAGSNNNNHFVWYPVRDMNSNETYYIASSYLDKVRISGPNRYATAVSISQEGWDKANTVILARGDNFPDALAGTPLAYKLNAPILLTRNGALPEETKNELIRLNAKNVIILGGTGAITNSVSDSVRNMGIQVRRIAGQNRFETARLIANELGSNFSTVVVANGYGFPDALAIAPYAARNGIPILLTEKTYIPSATKSLVNSANKTIVIGGTAVINQNLLKSMNGAQRVSGSTRYETALKIGTQFNFSNNEGFAVSGTEFPDALTGSVLAAKRNAPLLLMNPNYLPSETLQLSRNNRFNKISIFGGTAAVRTESILPIYR